MPVEDPESPRPRLLFLLSLLRERLFQSRAAAIGPVVGGPMELGDQVVTKRLGEVVLEILDERFLANQRQKVAAPLSEQTLGGLRRRFEVPLEVGEPVALDLAGSARVDGVTGNERPDRVDLFLETELVEKKRRLLLREVDDEHAMLLLHDRLERFDIGVGVDRQRVGHSHGQWHDAVQLLAALEDHDRPGTAGLVPLEERLYLPQVVGKAEALLPRQGFDVRFAGFEGLVPEAVENADEDGRIGTDEPLGREVEIEGDYRTLIVLAGDGL